MKARPSRNGLWAACVLVSAGVAFVWGFQSHRNRGLAYEPLSQLLGDGPALVDYTWLDPVSRPPESLRALGYVNSTFDPDAEARGIVVHEADRTWPGWNLYHDGVSHRATLMNMAGQAVFQWEIGDNLGHVEFLPNADLFAIEKDHAVARVDPTGSARWRTEVPAHHAPWVGQRRAWVLTRHVRVEPRLHADYPVFDERVTTLDLETGEVIEEISLLDVLLDSPYAFLFAARGDRGLSPESGPLDLLHPNQVVRVDAATAQSLPLYREGQLLVSLRHWNALVLIDPVTRNVDWIWGPSNLIKQHHPSILHNGNILVFDNRFGTSRIVEVDPTTGDVPWSWTADDFFSPTRGSVQRLPNGNTLISESDRGYAFEIDPSGETVWRFANPEVDPAGYRSVIWRMTRYADDSPAITALRAIRDLGPVAGS